ncbi:MAG: hypothetical protein COW08_06160 [Ignavibacteriales bacterium CG12_big_fil_rev_8_21_14_0_65_30_8]|nr:MAG: hypothetical protein COW08_06160 [Ignavibacteriales bacterium CG12_big_fil_rev_8_21_14_0_65_30_8]
MKKNSKKIILYNFMLIATIALFILAYVGVKLKYDILLKNKTLLEKELSNKKNLELNLLAEKQSLSTEARIEQLASTNLNLDKYLKPDFTISVKKADIEELNKKLGDKNE